jgi:hypothetical protein
MKNTEMHRYIVVKLQFEGIHRWENCPLPEVSFLKNYHRHIFFVELTKKVNHNDRDIEIIMLKREILNYLGTQPVQLKNSSCEDIAETLLNQFQATSVKVTEDNENGAIVTL